MNFLATYWWVFLILMFVFYALVLKNQLSRMKRLVSLEDEDEDEGFGIFKGAFTLVLFGILGSASGILFVVGVIVAVVKMR